MVCLGLVLNLYKRNFLMTTVFKRSSREGVAVIQELEEVTTFNEVTGKSERTERNLREAIYPTNIPDAKVFFIESYYGIPLFFYGEDRLFKPEIKVSDPDKAGKVDIDIESEGKKFPTLSYSLRDAKLLKGAIDKAFHNKSLRITSV